MSQQLRPKETLKLVSLKPFQEKYHEMLDRGELTAGEIARRLGWIRTDQRREGAPDTSRVLRTLGLRGQQSGKPKYGCQVRQRISYDLGVRLCEAMGLDPFEVGV